LYRALRVDEVAGKTVLDDAVDLQGTSVCRGKYLTTPEETFDYAPAGCTGLAVITSGQLPRPIVNESVTGKVASPEDITWEFFAVDDPFTDEQGRDHMAHAEIRIRRLSDRPEEQNQKPSKAMKRLLKGVLAAALSPPLIDP
jgi:hypothetical protein